MKLIILGIQGSGKGVQGKLIAEIFNLKHISTGDLLRNEISTQSELGKEISSYIDKGNLVPNSLINKIFFKHLPKDNFILDGYPRNKEQVEFLEKINPPDKIIYLDIQEKVVYERLAVRIQCKKCGTIYGKNKTPEKEGICDECQSKLERRKDDSSDEAIKKRIDLFNQETLPILKFYDSRVIRINGNQSVEDVFEDIRKKLENSKEH